MHDATSGEIVSIRIMLRDTVIPDSDIVFLPAPANLELRLRNMCKQEGEQRLALFLREVDNPRGETLVNKQRLLTAYRMGTDYRMQQRWILNDRLTPALMLFFTTEMFLLRERFAEIVFCF